MAIQMKTKEVAVKVGCEESNYKGFPTLVIYTGTSKPITFGYNKARAFVEYHNDILAFVKKCEATKSKRE